MQLLFTLHKVVQPRPAGCGTVKPVSGVVKTHAKMENGMNPARCPLFGAGRRESHNLFEVAEAAYSVRMVRVGSGLLALARITGGY